MTSVRADPMAERAWLVVEDGFVPEKANVYETLFTVGNGYLGTRGSLEEGHEGALPGTFLRGVFDHHDSAVIDLVRAPDWLSTSVVVNGTRLDVDSATVVEHHRVLDMRDGTLARTTVFEDSDGRRTRIETIRLASRADEHLCCLQVRITALNHTAIAEVHSGIDGTGYNLDRPPAYATAPVPDPQMTWHKWAKSKHLAETSRRGTEHAVYLETRTIDTGIAVGYASTTTTSPQSERSASERHKYVEQCVRVRLDANETFTMEKFACIYTSRDIAAEAVREACLKELTRHATAGFEACRQAHRSVWDALWAASDVRIEGDEAATLAVRFACYHLMIAANEQDERANIGAKSLSGEAYRGHTFWDTEIFLLPFFIYTQPATARALLIYRLHTLAGAKQNAREGSFRGARYAWESADTGVETTPKWSVDGAHRIWMGEEELHVTSAVAYGVLAYVAATGDQAFMARYGAEILFETSRFWASRLEAGTDGSYHLRGVVGPDEFHEHVDNNAYTNYQARWHLIQTARVFTELGRTHPHELKELCERIALMPDEVGGWVEAAGRVHVPPHDAAGVIEQFDGYFALDDLAFTTDENDMPVYPEGYHHYNLTGTKLLKQADVVMMTYVLPDEFSDEVKLANYEYYEPRTLHKSSLSPAVHSIMGIEVGDPARAVQYFRRSAFVDLIDNQGNTCEGMHIASAGGTWQTVVCGFGGFRVRSGTMTFKPWLPPEWISIEFKLIWRGNTVGVHIDHHTASFRLHAAVGVCQDIHVAGRHVALSAGDTVSVELSD